MTAYPIEAPPYGSPEWLEWRKHGLGASDLPAILGIDPYRSAYQLAAIKRGEASEEHAATPLQRWGLRMERVGLDWYSEYRQGARIEAGRVFGSTEHPHLWASLDGYDPAMNIGVEVKWAARWSEMPRRIEVQALGQNGIAHLDAVDVVKLSPYGEPTVIRVERDEDAIEDLLAAGEAWYARYVLGDEMPPLDGSPAARRALSALRGTEERQATAEQAGLMDHLRRTRDALKRLAATEEQLVRDIKSSMAGTGVLVGPGFRASWTPTKGRTTTAWQLVAEGLRTRVTAEEWDALVSIQTTTGDPGDRFTPTWTEQEPEELAA